MSKKKQRKDEPCAWCLACAHYGFACSSPIPKDDYAAAMVQGTERPDCYEYDRPA